jgi:hypothetical protein
VDEFGEGSFHTAVVKVGVWSLVLELDLGEAV